MVARYAADVQPYLLRMQATGPLELWSETLPMSASLMSRFCIPFLCGSELKGNFASAPSAVSSGWIFNALMRTVADGADAGGEMRRCYRPREKR